MKLTRAQERALIRLGQVAEGKAFLCSGHWATACSGLVEKGLAELLGSDGALSRAFTLTAAGKQRLGR